VNSLCCVPNVQVEFLYCLGFGAINISVSMAISSLSSVQCSSDPFVEVTWIEKYMGIPPLYKLAVNCDIPHNINNFVKFK
jgi:hypothetical protein